MIGKTLISLQVFLNKNKQNTDTKDKHYQIKGLQVIFIFCEKVASLTIAPNLWIFGSLQFKVQ